MPKIQPNEYPVQDATLSALYRKFETLKNTPGIKDKMALIAEYKGDEVFDKAIYFLLNPLITTGLDKYKVKKKIKGFEDCWVPFRFTMLIDYLRDHNTGRDEDIIVVQKYMANNPLYMDFIKSIVTKSYRMSVNTKTIDAVYGPDFLQVWRVQQAYPLEDYKMQDGEWFSLSQKLNGFHASYYKGKIISRQGKEITGCQHIINAIEFFDLQDYFIDGELIRKNDDDVSDEENFRLTVSIANSDSDDKHELQFVYYDLIPIDEFDEDNCSLIYAERLVKMQKLANTIRQTPLWKQFRMVSVFYSGRDQAQIKRWLNIAIKSDMEGLMLNRDTLYQRKRNKGILKVKAWYSCDLRVIGVEPGEGKYAGTLGKLVVDYKGNPLRLSGMSDIERDMFWFNPESIIGRIVEVKYKQETQDKTGKKSLQFATYQGVRTDKDEVSYN